MGNPIPAQHPAVVLRSQYRNMRSLVVVLLVALAALTTSVVILANDGDGTSSTTTFVGKAPHLSDPFAARTQPTQPQGGVDESSVASAISQSGSRSYPTLSAHSDTGPQARAKAWQEKLNSMTPQEREQAFGGR